MERSVIHIHVARLYPASASLIFSSPSENVSHREHRLPQVGESDLHPLLGLAQNLRSAHSDPPVPSPRHLEAQE